MHLGLGNVLVDILRPVYFPLVCVAFREFKNRVFCRWVPGHKRERIRWDRLIPGTGVMAVLFLAADAHLVPWALADWMLPAVGLVVVWFSIEDDDDDRRKRRRRRVKVPRFAKRPPEEFGWQS